MWEKKAKKMIGDRELAPESLMMSYGYHPAWSEGAVKAPIFATATFTFETAEAGKASLGPLEKKLRVVGLE